VWNTQSEESFQNNLRSAKVEAQMDRFSTTSSSEAAESLCNLLNAVASESLKRVKTLGQRNKRVKREQYSGEIQFAKRNFKNAKRNFLKSDKNTDRRVEFIKARRKYKQVIYRVQKHTKEQDLHKLAKLEKSDPKSFWRAVKQLLSSNESSKEDISNTEWVNYFSKLLNAKADHCNQELYDYVVNSLPVIEREAGNSGPIDYS
jgi:hypothetical protein